MVIVAICAAIWQTGQDGGWIATVVAVSAITYWINHFRCRPILVPSTLFAFPFIATLLFCIALAMGLHHPPWMVPPGWQWPPFTTIQERLTHAFALSIWVLFFGIPTVLIGGIIRRAVVFIALQASKQENATNKPMDTKRRIDRF